MLGSDDFHQSISVVEFDQELNAYLVRTTTRMGAITPVLSVQLIEPRDNKILLIAKRYREYLNSALEWKQVSNHIILKYPLAVDSIWTTDDYESVINYKVVGFVALKVQAGNFENVCEVRKNHKYYDEERKIKSFGIFYDYYAPNVGLIKEEIVNEDKTISPALELVRYNVK